MKIKNSGQIPRAFHQRLYHFLGRNFRRDNHFYTIDYFQQIAQFCNDNAVVLSIAEVLAFNFFYLSKSQAVPNNDFLKTYLEIEKDEHQIEFMNVHINQAQKIINALFRLDTQQSVDFQDAQTLRSAEKIYDILHLFYAYQPDEFEQYAKAKMRDDAQTHDDYVEIEEWVRAEFLAMQKGDKNFKTKKFQDMFSDSLKHNINTMLGYYERETKIFRNMKLN